MSVNMFLRIVHSHFEYLHANRYKMKSLAVFAKTRREQLGLTQEEFAVKARVTLTVIRKKDKVCNLKVKV